MNPYYKRKTEDLNMTLEEVATSLGVTKQRVLQIEKKAMQKLRHPSRANLLRHLVDETAELPTKLEIETFIEMLVNRQQDLKKGGRAIMEEEKWAHI